MITERQIHHVIGSTAVGNDGGKLGKVGEVYLDDETGRPEWATVHTGLFGTKESFVPLAQADLSGDQVRFPYAKAKDAPRVNTDGHLSPEEEEQLYRYYGLSDSGTPSAPTRSADSGGRQD